MFYSVPLVSWLFIISYISAISQFPALNSFNLYENLSHILFIKLSQNIYLNWDVFSIKSHQLFIIRKSVNTHTHTHTHIYANVYLYICLIVYECSMINKKNIVVLNILIKNSTFRMRSKNFWGWQILFVNLKIMEHNINYETTTTADIQRENIYSSSSNDYRIYNNDNLTTSG